MLKKTGESSIWTNNELQELLMPHIETENHAQRPSGTVHELIFSVDATKLVTHTRKCDCCDEWLSHCLSFLHIIVGAVLNYTEFILQIVRTLIKRGNSINIGRRQHQSRHGGTVGHPFVNAACAGNLHLVQLLVELGCPTERCNCCIYSIWQPSLDSYSPRVMGVSSWRVWFSYRSCRQCPCSQKHDSIGKSRWDNLLVGFTFFYY